LGKIGKIELKIGIENWGKLGRWFKCNLTLKKGRSSISFKNTLLRLPDTIIFESFHTSGVLKPFRLSDKAVKIFKKRRELSIYLVL
jgi:hypothetical protein